MSLPAAARPGRARSAGEKTEPWLSVSQINAALPCFSYSFHIFPLNLGPSKPATRIATIPGKPLGRL
ncbi:hypothetical protein PCL1606_30690 [Pseudomonas chlororaphis]|uniref:Uncharacterized protein n=1 Tax=Pseudomonas chlororaphis TaxID=587753 RepID=A0A0D5Y0D3_9PSED|nr:hypothetical protein PCL1606_30690 [Pseudomonas chlororaphis]